MPAVSTKDIQTAGGIVLKLHMKSNGVGEDVDGVTWTLPLKNFFFLNNFKKKLIIEVGNFNS